MSTRRETATGFALAELLVALALGLLLVGASLQVYLGAKRALRWQTASSRLDADGHWALSLLARDLHAGAQCAGRVGGRDDFAGPTGILEQACHSGREL